MNVSKVYHKNIGLELKKFFKIITLRINQNIIQFKIVLLFYIKININLILRLSMNITHYYILNKSIFYHHFFIM